MTSRVLLGVLALMALGGGCARVRPHERQHLAHPAMQAPAWPQVDRGDRHVFVIREGTAGATGGGGGGCGCD